MKVQYIQNINNVSHYLGYTLRIINIAETSNIGNRRLCSQDGFDKNLVGGYLILVIDCTI
jgi:hypothetical protein